MKNTIKISARLKKNYLTKNPNQTKKLGKFFAEKILRRRAKKGAFILGLRGDVGGGKTTFMQGFARGLGIREKILSPTFVIVKRFKIPPASSIIAAQTVNNFYHIDCYRIKKARDILDLGFKEVISNPQNIVAIEWSERIGKILPKNILALRFEFISKRARKIVVE